ncbi:MAG TPA: hypothetical protein ENK04_09860 [Gammaproteobacteria bacterium]|nr:hypothetical protein [Gammaproteobacteria bacterium]
MRNKPTIAIMLCMTGLPLLASAGNYLGGLTEQLTAKINEANEEANQINDLAKQIDGQVDQTAMALEQARQSINNAGNFSMQPGAGFTNNMDVIGLRLGMTAQEAKAALQTYDMTMQVQEQYSQLPRVPDSRYLHQIHAISNAGEQVVIEFAPPPREAVIVRLTRTTKYMEGARPALVKTQQALRQKYGAPTMENRKNRMHMSFWLHDKAGNRVASASSVQARRCTQASRVSIDRLIASQRQDRIMAECGVTLDVQLGTGVRGNGRVGSLTATLSNPAEMVRATQKTRAYIRQSISAQVESVGAPRL